MLGRRSRAGGKGFEEPGGLGCCWFQLLFCDERLTGSGSGNFSREARRQREKEGYGYDYDYEVLAPG